MAVGTYLKFLHEPNLYTVSWPCYRGWYTGAVFVKPWDLAVGLQVQGPSGFFGKEIRSLGRSYRWWGPSFLYPLGFSGDSHPAVINILRSFRGIHLLSTSCSMIYAPTFPTKQEKKLFRKFLKIHTIWGNLFLPQARSTPYLVVLRGLILSSCRQLPWFRLEGRALR